MSSYHMHILLPSDCTNVEASPKLRELLVDAFAEEEDVSVGQEGLSATVVTFDNNSWICKITWNEAETVVAESREMAEMFGAGRSDGDRAKIAACTKRLEVICDPDPDMAYFNDYLAIVELLKQFFAPCWAFDPGRGEFLN